MCLTYGIFRKPQFLLVGNLQMQKERAPFVVSPCAGRWEGRCLSAPWAQLCDSPFPQVRRLRPWSQSRPRIDPRTGALVSLYILLRP